jgi:DNA-directed RNA polymerase beta' subunit
MNEYKNPSKIIGIQFSILSPDEIRNNSVVEITSKDTYINNKAVINGLFDPRMGVLEPGLICPTDGMTYIDTPGYFGHIELARPVFYIHHLREIIKICKCVCFKCSKLLINKTQHKHILDKNGEFRWSYVSNLAAKVKRCGETTEDGCGCKQPDKIKLEGMANIIATWDTIVDDEDKDKKKINMKLIPEIVLKIFKRISDDDVHFMGFSPVWSRPDWMICQVLPVAPPSVRPSVKHDAQQRCEDDLTHIYITIVKTNNYLKEKMLIEETNPNVIEMSMEILQHSIAMIANNKIKGVAPMAQRSGRPLQCISGRINSKNGRIRGNLMGKRVDFSARSVITGDPNLSIQQLGVPMKIAKNITKPVVVNDRNKDFLLKLVQNGPEEHPGAKILERKSGENISLRYVDRNSISLENGDIVHRHMMDGDMCLFNRQPSLHRPSMMGHIAKIMRVGDTFRMNVGDTKPYNADFDGDEMNLHFAQNIVAETELRHLAAVPYQIISSENNTPIIGIFQDSLLGSYRFTRKDINMTTRDAMNLLMTFPRVDVDSLRKNKNNILTSFEVLSQILPKMSLKYKTGLFEEDVDTDEAKSNNILEIKNGTLIRGQFDKSVLGSSTKSIIHRICNDFGNMACANFNDDLQNIITEYMKSSSFSVGISDLIADQKTQNDIIKVIEEQKLDVQKVIDQVHLGIFENNTANSNMKEFETQVNNILNKATEISGNKGRKSLSKDNRFVMIVASGSKGTALNISQMISCLGQQNVDAKRIPYGFDNRTLPHYCKFDDSPGARGFIENSYISGLTAPELFFHAMGGRIGLIDTAVKSVTSETPIIIIENNIPRYVQIGQWIDKQLLESVEAVQHFEDRNLELLNIDGVFIPTTDYDGNVTWGSVTAITRHDPGTQLYEIKTLGGRKVIVSEAKSLLIWKEVDGKEQFKEVLTPEIVVGDFVPVTANLCSSPTEMKEVDMTEYFPKDKYVHGSDFILATKLINDSMKERIQIPRGWWNDNNGKSFTLPYTKKSTLTRTIKRSNITNIQPNMIYPYNATREHVLIPDKFDLNEENGIFIGLFLAEGHASLKSSSIAITNNDSDIQNFVTKWFSKMNINCSLQIKTNKVGTSSTVIGKSAILTQFLHKFVGHLAYHKYVPDVSFIANDKFVVGLLNGYFSGDGTIGKNSIDCSSASPRLIEGISMLLSRFDIFGKISTSQIKNNNFGTKNISPSYRLSIRSKWAKKFAEKINLIMVDKNEKLKLLSFSSEHINFKQHNDVVLDKIIEINIISVENYPKLYDLTVPSTLNFGLANGLQVRDTSQTGYIQRRLIKGLEDLKIEYDMTVRNSKGKIIQFEYGEDGFDAMKVENQNLPLAGMSIEDIYRHYDIDNVNVQTIFTKDTLKRLKKEKDEAQKMCKKYIDEMLLNREEIVNNLFKGKNESGVRIPVGFQYIIGNIQGQLNLSKDSAVDITPLEAFILIEEYYKKMNSIPCIKTTELFKIMYFYYLSPRDLLIFRRFHRAGLILLLEMILLKFKEAIVHPGEMVGVVAGQSVGAPTTQLTLNTFHNSGTSSKSNVTRGVPRIEEILRLTKNPKNPSMTIYLKEQDEIDQDKAGSYTKIMEHTRLIDIVKSMQICFDPSEKSTTIIDDKELLEQFYEFEDMVKSCIGGDNTEETAKSKWIIRLEIEPEILLDKGITMDDIHFAISNSHYKNEVQCVFADYNSNSNLIFRIRTKNSSILTKNKKQNTTAEPLDQSDEIYMLKTFQDQLLNNIVLRGINGVKNCQVRKLQNNLVKEEGKYIKKDIYVLDTTGTNLLDALALDFIDFKRSQSNDIREIFDVLGIEAARQSIYNELSEVMEFSGVYINYHHSSLLCDRMTCNKDLVSIFRSGLLNDNVGPIAKATFEVHTEVLLKAARHADFDHMRGVSANVMTGQYGCYGTNAFQLILDLKSFANLESIEVDDNNKKIKELFGDLNIGKDTMCSLDNMKIVNNVSNIKELNEDNICDDEYDPGY